VTSSRRHVADRAVDMWPRRDRRDRRRTHSLTRSLCGIGVLGPMGLATAVAGLVGGRRLQFTENMSFAFMRCSTDVRRPVVSTGRLIGSDVQSTTSVHGASIWTQRQRQQQQPCNYGTVVAIFLLSLVEWWQLNQKSFTQACTEITVMQI